MLSDGRFIFVHNDLFVYLAKPHLMGLWVSPLGRPLTFFLKAGTPGTLWCQVFLENRLQQGNFLKQKIKRLFLCPWRAGPHFWALCLLCHSLQPMPVCPQASHHLSITTQAAPGCSPLLLGVMPSPLAVVVIPVPSHTPSPNWGCSELSEGGRLLSPPKILHQSATARAKQISSSLLCGCSPLGYAVHMQTAESKHVN